jgi:hypothetical protein
MEAVRDFEEDERAQELRRTGLAADRGLLTANMAQRLIARFVDLVVVFALALVVSLATGASENAFIGFIFATALRVLHDRPESEWPALLTDAQRRQLAGLAREEHELAADSD